jgi:hypothetical protein
MNELIQIVVALGAVIAVAGIVMAVWNSVKRGDGNASQKMMRLRVILQGLAIVLLLGAFYFFGRQSG